MESISRKDISLRIDKLKNRVSEMNSNLIKYNEELNNRYDFAKEFGIKKDNLVSNNEDIIQGLNSYIQKVNEIKEEIDKDSNEEINDEIKILNNMLYLDDVRLGSITELLQENKELCNREYFNKIADKANQLIREEELKEIDSNIINLSKKSNFIERLTGKDKIKKVLLENYSLKRNEVINKKYIPENKSLLEIINITRNCGYKSQVIDEFIYKISQEYNLGELVENSLVPINKKQKVPFFYNKEFIDKINLENEKMMDDIATSRQKTKAYAQFQFSKDMLKNDILTLELFNYNNVIDEVI